MAILKLAWADPVECRHLLCFIAQSHWDDGWRFNAIQTLSEFGWLDEVFRVSLMLFENESETAEYLHQLAV